MKKALLTLCACIFVCTHDCHADDVLDQCILDNATQSELDTYNSYTGSDMNSVMHKSMTYRALYDKYCSTGDAGTTDGANDTDDASVNAVPSSTKSADGTLKPVCASDMRHGKDPVTDKCVECPVGKFFNAKDSANGYCSTAIALGKSDLKYGYKSRTEKSRVSHQCWTKKNPSEYKACVLTNMPQLRLTGVATMSNDNVPAVK